MTVRALGPDDAAAFQALRLRGLAEVPTAFASSHEEEVGLPLDEIARRLQPREDRAVFGAFETGALCGVIGVQREGLHKLRHKAYIWGMYVAPEARGSGRGQRLMQAALDHAWTVLQVRQVNLGVHAGNSAAMQLYQRCGFVVFGTERGALQVDGQLQDEHHMVCVAPAAAPVPPNPAKEVSMIEGSCHCGAATWRFRGLPEGATACNCTVCRRYGVLWAYDYEGEGIHVSGPTRAYVRGKAIEFHFCPTCGCVSHWRAQKAGEDGRRRIAVNLRLSEPGPIAQVPIDHFDGLDTFDDLPRDGKCVADYWF